MKSSTCLVFVSCYIMINNVVGRNCDFDNSTICNWIQSNQDNGNWTVGSKISPLTGPPNGHTSTSANDYCYLEAEDFKDQVNNVIANQSSVLVSPELKGSGTACFRFFYYMFGADVNTLSVGVVRVNQSQYIDDTSRRELFSKKGNQGQKWFCGRISFNISNSDRIYIEAKTGKSFASNVAVDDLLFEREAGCALPCESTQLPTTTQNTVTNFTEIDNNNQTVSGLNTLPITPPTTTPKDDIDPNILFYLISIPVVLFVTVTLIAIVCYCKRSKNESLFAFGDQKPETFENPQYEEADEVYDEIPAYDTPHDGDPQADYAAPYDSYLQPAASGNNLGPYDKLKAGRATDGNVGFRQSEPSVGLYVTPAGRDHITYNRGLDSMESDYMYMGRRGRIPNEQAPDRPALPPRESGFDGASMPPTRCIGPQSRGYIQPF